MLYARVIGFRHVEWLTGFHQCRDTSVAGERDRGRGRKTWKAYLTDDIRKMNYADKPDRGLWRSGILGNRPSRANAEICGRQNDEDKATSISKINFFKLNLFITTIDIV